MAKQKIADNDSVEKKTEENISKKSAAASLGSAGATKKASLTGAKPADASKRASLSSATQKSSASAAGTRLAATKKIEATASVKTPAPKTAERPLAATRSASVSAKSADSAPKVAERASPLSYSNSTQIAGEDLALRQNPASAGANVSASSAALKNPSYPSDNPQKKNGAKVIAIVAAIVVLLLLGFFATRGVWLGGDGTANSAKTRENTLSLAQKYLEKGQFDDAMRLLNELLQADINDKEADELLDMAIALKKEYESRNNSPQNANFSFDTDGIANALREQNERNQETINRLLAEQQRNASDNARAEEEAIARKAAEEARKKEDAERKAKEEALAQKNKELKAKIDSVNNKVLAGKADLNTGNIDSALSNFEQASSQLPLPEGEPEFSASKYSEIAWALYDAASNEKDEGRKNKLNSAAVQYVNKALANNQNDPTSHYILGMNYIETGDWEKAQKELAAAVQNDPDNYLYYYNLGRAQFRLRNFTAARSSFESSVRYNNNFDPAYFNLGMTCQRLKLNKDALAAFRSAHQVNPNYSRAYLEEARILNSAFNDSKGALEAYKKVIELDPVNTQALNECGSVYAGMGNNSEAESCYRRAIALLKPGDKDPITYYNLATALFNQNKLPAAQSNAKLAYEQMDALTRNSDKAMVVYNYALIEDTLGNADKAITLYKEVLVLDPNNAKTKTNLGKMFMHMNPPDADSALSFYLDAYNTSPSFELENNLGSAYLMKKDYSNAITYFQNAIKKNPKDNAVRFNLGQAYSGAGDFDNAKTTYLEILNSDTSNWDVYIEVAKVFIALKDTANAEAYLKILQQKNPTYKKAEVDVLLEATR